MAQDITLLGAQYNDVPAVQLPKTGGGTARFDDASITTAVASDVTQGKVFLAADGTITTGTNSGGGGGAVVVIDEQLPGGGTAKHITAVDISDTTAVASDVAQGKYFYASSGVKTAGTASGGSSNIVTGTFTGTTTDTAMDVTLNYSGNGYPIAVIVAPTGGIAGNSGFSTLIQRYCIGIWFGYKDEATVAPTYTGYTNDYMRRCAYYKNSTSNATNYSSNSNNTTPFYDKNAYSGAGSALHIRSATKMSVYFSSADSYGFATNIEYTYYIIYSS